MGWRNDIRLELMREAAQEQGICRRCGGPLDDADDATCAKCQYDDWHEDQEWHDSHLADDYDEDEQEGE